MSGFLYWPYDEVLLSTTPDRKTVTVKTPWIEVSVAGNFEPPENLEALLQKFEGRSLAPTDLGLLHWFFRHFEKYPLCYILPTPKGGAKDVHTPQASSLEKASLETILLEALKSDGRATEDALTDLVSDTLAQLPRQAFLWDLETALSFSKQGSGTHPESLLSVARRFHLLELLENDRGKDIFQQIQSLPKDRFAQVAGRIVKQNLYVTEECQRALTPALALAQSARPAMEHFIQQERGHDRLLGAALKALVPDPASVPVSTQTIVLMSLLRLAAKRNFLAFSIAVDFFERNSYEKTDPLAKLLLAGGYNDAAKQIQRHMEINDAGEHENMGLQFLEPMAPCEEQYAREAFKLAEAISLVMNSVTQSAVKEE